MRNVVLIRFLNFVSMVSVLASMVLFTEFVSFLPFGVCYFLFRGNITYSVSYANYLNETGQKKELQTLQQQQTAMFKRHSPVIILGAVVLTGLFFGGFSYIVKRLIL